MRPVRGWRGTPAGARAGATWDNGGVSEQPQDDAATQPEAGTAPGADSTAPAADVVTASTAPGAVAPATPAAEPELHQVGVRRAPKWSVFIVLGLLVGLLVTIAVTTAFPADPNVGMGMTVFIVGIFGVPAGAALGALAALIADRVSFRRVREVTAERGEVHTEPEPEPAPEPEPEPEADPA